MTDHLAWDQLPAPVRAAVTTHTGPVTAVHHIPHGYNCQHAAILATAVGDVFVKAARGAEATALHDREEQAAPHTGGAGPAFLWRARPAGWDVLGFTAVPDARHADLTPGSPDLPAVAELLSTASTLTAPPGLPYYTDQWADQATPAELARLGGRALVHGDINPHNLLAATGRVWLVDWATATTGPAWADTAEAAIRLLEDGHTAADAHAWASRIPAWQNADPKAIATWAELRCRAWTVRIGQRGAEPSNRRHQALAQQVAGALTR